MSEDLSVLERLLIPLAGSNGWYRHAVQVGPTAIAIGLRYGNPITKDDLTVVVGRERLYQIHILVW